MSTPEFILFVLSVTAPFAFWFITGGDEEWEPNPLSRCAPLKKRVDNQSHAATDERGE